MIPSVYYILGSLTMVIWIIVGVAEVLKSYRVLGIPSNPIIQETCWLCHRVLGEDVALYHLAKSAHRVICGRCAKAKINQKHVYHYELLRTSPEPVMVDTLSHPVIGRYPRD